MKPRKENLVMPLLPIKFFISKGEKCSPIAVSVHWHNTIEILNIVKGKGSQQLDDQIIEFDEGDFIIVWSDQFHSTYSNQNKDCEIHVLQINLEGFILPGLETQVVQGLGDMRFFDKLDLGHQAGDEIFSLYTKVVSELEVKAPGYSLVASSLAYQLFSCIYRNEKSLPIKSHEKFGGRYSDRDKKIATLIFEYIHTNYAEPISLETAAASANLSVSQFLRTFKKITGRTFKDYLNAYRVEKALSCLAKGDNVTESALKCGYSDINTFIRNFKKYKGLTPTAYMLQQ